MRWGKGRLTPPLNYYLTAAKKVLGCSSTASTAVLGLKLGLGPLRTKRDVRKLRGQYKLRRMPKKRLPTIANSAEWEKVMKGRAGIWWDSVVGGNQEDGDVRRAQDK